VGVVDGDAEHVTRQHVGGELQAVELAADRSCEGVRQRRFADTRNVLNEQVSASQQTNKRQA